MYSNEEYLLDLLIESGLISDADIQKAKNTKKPTESPLECLIKTGVVGDEQVAQTVAVNSGMEYIDLHGFAGNPAFKGLVSMDVAKKYKIVPIGMNGSTLQVVVADPYDFETLDALPHVLQPDIEFFCSTPALIRNVQMDVYGNDIIGDKPEPGAGGDSGDAPVIKLVNNIFLDAFKNRASDIHIEPLEKDVRVRFRIDGVLHDVEHHPKRLHSAIIARIKIQCGTMSIDEKRIPQDGRIQMKFGDKELDMRVSIIPTSNGESVVMRVLDKSSLRLGLSDLGFLSDDQETFENLITLPDGIVLVTGPTGSGKTTTLYASLRQLDKNSMNISTVEDPVEYHLDGITQTQTHEKIGMTFSVALRSLLRQDPDVIMLGEIRDHETAHIAVQAALTGHLVLSTLHTNDAPSSITRLVNIGLEPFLVGAAVNGVLAQRLIRRLCMQCKATETPTEEMAEFLAMNSFDATEVWAARGCDKCRKTGYSGRVGIYELLTVDDQLRDIIARNPNVAEFRRLCIERGMVSLRADGMRKVAKGLTTVQEVLRVTEASH